MEACKTNLTEEEKERIINNSLPFIKYTAYRLAHRLPPQLSLNDLVSVGIMGLLDALRRYTKGRVKLPTFVEYRIKGAMLDELRSHDWMPRTLKDKVGRIRKTEQNLEKDLGRVPEGEEVARSLGITLDEYYRTLQSARNAVVFSFEDFREKTGEETDIDVTECIPDTSMKTPLQQLEENSIREELAVLIDRLPEKEKLILSLYYWEELTLKKIGAVLNLSEGRVSQLHSQTLAKLKAQLHAPVLH